jgi:CCR4-NOT transcription complex subunit 4
MSYTGIKTDDDDDDLCPICAEMLDATDKEFFPCPCGFQFCCFCYNRMAEVVLGEHFRCPACRKPFDVEGAGESESTSDSESETDSEP